MKNHVCNKSIIERLTERKEGTERQVVELCKLLEQGGEKITDSTLALNRSFKAQCIK